jgi:hypothetical protein
MCEVLVFARNNTHIDPIKDRAGCYKLGMPVIVFEDGHTWGREESKLQWIAEGNTAASWPNQGVLAILKLPGVPAAKAIEFISAQTEDDAGAPVFDSSGAPLMYRRRRWQLVVSSLPTAVKSTINSTGEYTTTVSAVRAYLNRIRDAAQYTGFD